MNSKEIFCEREEKTYTAENSYFLFMNFIFFGIYALAMIVLFVFIAIFLMNIREYRAYSRYINPVLRIYIALIIIISIW